MFSAAIPLRRAGPVRDLEQRISTRSSTREKLSAKYMPRGREGPNENEERPYERKVPGVGGEQAPWPPADRPSVQGGPVGGGLRVGRCTPLMRVAGGGRFESSDMAPGIRCGNERKKPPAKEVMETSGRDHMQI